MSNLRINFPALPIMRKQLTAAKQQVLDETRDLIVKISEKALMRVKALTPVNTGRTREKWRLFVLNRKGSSGKAQGAFFTAIDHPYNRVNATRMETTEFVKRGAKIKRSKTGKRKKDRTIKKRRQVVVNDGTRSILTDLEFGTKAHTIPVGEKGFLAFNIGATKIFTRKPVKHPGTKAYSMTTIAAAEANKEAEIGLEQILARAIRTIEGRAERNI